MKSYFIVLNPAVEKLQFVPSECNLHLHPSLFPQLFFPAHRLLLINKRKLNTLSRKADRLFLFFSILGMDSDTCCFSIVSYLFLCILLLGNFPIVSVQLIMCKVQFFKPCMIVSTIIDAWSFTLLFVFRPSWLTLWPFFIISIVLLSMSFFLALLVAYCSSVFSSGPVNY